MIEFQRLVSLCVRLRPNGFRRCRNEFSTRISDRRQLQTKISLHRRNLCFTRGATGGGFCQRDLKAAAVKPHQQIAGVNALIVGDQNRNDRRRDAR